MNVLLIYPEFPDTFWSFKHALAFVHKRAALPPLGLLTVAAMLPADWTPRLVDLNVRDLTRQDLAWADCAFISAMVVQRASAQAVIARCHAGGLRVVAGGPLFQNESAAFPLVDHFVLNEAELTLPEFLRDLAAGQSRRIYDSPAFADLHATPVPRWDLLQLRHYASMCIQFSRGCPFNCDFCNVTALLGHRVRIKSSTQILAELDALYARGWRDEVFFVDDNFIGNKRFLKTDLLPALIAWRRGKSNGVVFYTEASINLADDAELMDLMARAGFHKVFIGIETPDNSCQRILQHIYAPRPYYQRVRTFLREYQPPPIRRPLQWRSLLPLARSWFHLGVLGRERWHYWRLLFWTQFRHPRLLAEAVTLAIYGHHFRKICERAAR